MKKVIHINATSAGGAFVVAQRLSGFLNQSGKIQSSHLVYTGSPGDYNLWSDSYWKSKISFGLHALEKLDFLRFEKDKSVRFAYSHALTGIDLLSNKLVKDADVVHLHWINKGFVSLKGLDRLLHSGQRVVWTCHDMWPFTGGCYYSGSCANYLKKCGSCPLLKNPHTNDLSHTMFEKKANVIATASNLAFVTPSEWMANLARSSQIADTKTIHHIPNGIDTAMFQPADKKQIKQELGLDTEKKTILFSSVNIHDKRKGYGMFLELIKQIEALGFGDYQVVFIGGKLTADDVGNEKVKYTGYISDAGTMASWFQAADIYVSTSVEDNLPTTIMESLACGTPVAAFGIGGIPEMVEHGVTGVLAEKGNIIRLAENMVELLNHKSGYAEEISHHCRKKALTNYAGEMIARRHMELYDC